MNTLRSNKQPVSSIRLIKQFVLGSGRPLQTAKQFRNIAIINSFIAPIQSRPFELLIKLAWTRRYEYPGKTSFEELEPDPQRVWKLIYLLRNQLARNTRREIIAGDKAGLFWLRVEPKAIRFKKVLLEQDNKYIQEILNRCRLV